MTKATQKTWIFDSDYEAALASYVGDVTARGYSCSRKDLYELVSETSSFLNLRKDVTFVVSDTWLQGYLDRWPALILADGSSMNACDTDSKAVVMYYSDLMRILQKYNLLNQPHRIFSVYDTAVCTRQDMSTEDVIDSARATVISCMNATGHVLPPYVIFKGHRPLRSLFEETSCTMSFEDALPGTACTMSDTGSANGRIFLRFLKRHFLSIVACSADNPVLLLYDGRRPFINMPVIEWAEKLNIVLYLLPAHVCRNTHIGAFMPLKHMYERQSDDFLAENPDRIIAHCDICSIIGKAYEQAMTQEIIVATFERMGVVPFNSSA